MADLTVTMITTRRRPLSQEEIEALIDLRIAQLRTLAAQMAVDWWRELRSELAMSYTEEEKQRILAEAHGHLERLRHFEPSERSNIIPLRRQREPEPEPPPRRMFNERHIGQLSTTTVVRP